MSSVGRQRGFKPPEVILFNRYNCLFYETITETYLGKVFKKDENGNPIRDAHGKLLFEDERVERTKVVGRNYSIHDDKVKELQVSFMRASDTQTTKVLKCAKRCEYKEDFFRWLPNLFDHTKKIDISNPPLDLFGKDDVAISEVVDKPKAMQALDKLIDDTIQILLDLDMAKLAIGLQKKYDGMKTEDRNIGVVEGKSQKELIKAQIADFSF